MMRYKFTIGLAGAAFALSLVPATAQDRSRPADSPSVGSAVPRDSGSSSGSSSSNSGSSGGNSTSSGGSTPSSAWTGNTAREAPRSAPVNPERTGYGDQRHGGGGSTVGRAVPRGEAGGSSGSESTATTRSGDGANRQAPSGRNAAVPTYSRPRDGRNPLGTAVERPDGYYRDGRPYSYT